MENFERLRDQSIDGVMVRHYQSFFEVADSELDVKGVFHFWVNSEEDPWRLMQLHSLFLLTSNDPAGIRYRAVLLDIESVGEPVPIINVP